MRMGKQYQQGETGAFMGTVLFAVSDTERIRELTEALTAEGHEVVMASDCARALMEAAARTPQAIVVDVSVAARNGFATCRELSVVPLLVLAEADSVDDVDELLALSSGADDYIRMPCSARILQARIAAAMRRVDRSTEQRSPAAHQIGALSVNTGMRRAAVFGTPLHLTRIEFELLATLAENRQRVLTRVELLNRVWGPWSGDDHVVEVHLSRLRRKIVAAGGPRIAESVPGVGYRLGAEAA